MLKITNIQPQYRIDEKNNVTVDHYLVSFELKKKLSNGDTLQLSGDINSELNINIDSIKGKILFHLKDVIPTES